MQAWLISGELIGDKSEFVEAKMKKKVSIKTFALVMSIIFTILTFAGAGYVLLNHGQVNAGYACVPMVLTIAFLALYRTKKQ